MPTATTLTEWIILGVLVVVLLMLFSVRVALSRIEARLNRVQQSAEATQDREVDSPGSHAQESAFEQFLAEDPSRLGLTKTEQFAAFRQWRKDKGMNWSAEQGS